MLSSLLAVVTGESLVTLVIWLVIAGLIFFVVWWALGQINLPEPFNKIIRVVVVLACAILLINVLLGIVGHPFIRW